MKNFVRLLQFAWPYRVRFSVSIGCAVMVALMYFTNIGAVFPLLQILFKHSTAQTWVLDQIAFQETEIASFRARIEEVDFLFSLVPLQPVEARTRFESHRKARLAEETAAVIKRQQAEAAKAAPIALGDRDRRDQEVAEARMEELRSSSGRVKSRTTTLLERRRTALEREIDRAGWWRNRYQDAEPWIRRWLPSDTYQTLVLLMVAVMVGIALKGIFQFLQDVIVADIMQLTLFDIRNHFYRRTLALDLGQFSEQGSADLIARFTNDMESLHQGLAVILSKLTREPLRIVACLSGAFWFNWRLTCLTLVLVPVSAVTTYRAGKVMKRAVRKSLESMSNIYKILQESIQGIKVVQAFTMEGHERERFYRETKTLYKKSVRVATIDALSDPVLELLSLTTVVIALLAGSYLVLRDTTTVNLGLFRLQLASSPMTIEDLFTLYGMLAAVSDPIRKLANVHPKLQRAAAAADRICLLMDREPEILDKTTAQPLPRHRKSVEFDKIVFGYDSRGPVLRGLTLTVRHGETIALVGPNGCGKSTLMNLLPRFWDPESGSIRVDGVDIRDVSRQSLREQIGLVTQETILFRGTIGENIAYGTPGAPREAIESAARRAYAHQFILNLPQGYDTPIGDLGAGLSGGQRQRIALARAMLRDPAILILDEATSAVDIQDEALIRKAIEEFARGRTTFLITHNLGSLQFADRIALMDSGRVEAIGTDAELLKSSLLYRRLHEIHFQRESA